MACRGVYFALADPDADRLLRAGGDKEVVEIVREDIETRWDTEWLQEVDKAWDAIHRCLTDGTLRCKGRSVLEKCVLGGRQLHAGGDYIVSFLTPDEVRAVSEVVQGLTKDWFLRRYSGLGASGYDGPIGPTDFEYTWEYFDQLRQFFARSSAAGKAVIFTVDQ
jgi:hypothetical protein